MPLHIHTIRSCCAAALAAIPAVILCCSAYGLPRAERDLAPVTGRVTRGGQPLGGMWIVFEEAGPHGREAYGSVQPNGTFQTHPRDSLGRDGMVPATYRVYFLLRSPDAPDSLVAPEYQDARTSRLVVRVEPGWNDISFDLHEAP